MAGAGRHEELEEQALRCSECGREPEAGRKLCRRCLDLAQARMARRRAALGDAGACEGCGALLSPEETREGRTRCQTCREASRSRYARWEQRHPGYVRRWRPRG